MKPVASIVVPFYNEEDNVVPLIEKIEAVFKEMPDYDYECLLVNDGSTDETAARIDAAALRNSAVRPVHMVQNFGQSAALHAGMCRATGDYILTLDGDLQNDPADFPRFLELLQDYDCVCGYRANRNDHWIRLVSSRIANVVRNAILHDGIRDSGCGSKGFRRACVQNLVSFNGLHRFLAVFMRAQGYTIAECPVTHHARHAGTSKYGVNNRLWRGLYDLIGVAWLRRRHVCYRVDEQ
ncbi:MAG: glycosyltransferase family 2 protein [Candidatus Hydrogenedentes bacterium]|nr:glycosyltransferase family 2 protein [Candidatus Hydrogenedentota bacterium]